MDPRIIGENSRYRSGQSLAGSNSDFEFDPMTLLKRELGIDCDHHLYPTQSRSSSLAMVGCSSASDGEFDCVKRGRNRGVAEGEAEEMVAPPLEEADLEMILDMKMEPKMEEDMAAPPEMAPPMAKRPPIIIHTYSPKVVHAEKWNFKWIVQSLTGSPDTRADCLRRRPSPPPNVAAATKALADSAQFRHHQQLTPYPDSRNHPSHPANHPIFLPSNPFQAGADPDSFVNYAPFNCPH